MGSHIDLDPDELDAYIARLNDYAAQMREQMRGMLDRCRALNYSWRDAAYGDYWEEFMQGMMQIERGVELLEEPVPRLRARSELAHELYELE